jgi:cytochrome c oxidase assembly protein subunit 16
MAVFPSKKYRSATEAATFAARYRAMMGRHPFLLFGLPFMSVIVAGSFVLTPATAVRYERHDRKVRQLTRDEELGVGKGGRKVNIKDEYYVRLYIYFCALRQSLVTNINCVSRG